jgi:hypothetical protein
LGQVCRLLAENHDRLADEVLEAWRRNSMMSLVYPWVRIQARIDHNPVDEVIHHGRNAVDTAEPLVKVGRNSG